MSTNRLVVGALGGGNFGLKCSLPGVNALLADDNDPALFSFCSNWGNLVRLGASGIAGPLTGSSQSDQGTGAIAHGLGFTPFVEARPCEGSQLTVYFEHCIVSYVVTGTTSGGHPIIAHTQQNRVSGSIDSTNVAFVIHPWTRLFFPDPNGDPVIVSDGPSSTWVVWYAYRDPR